MKLITDPNTDPAHLFRGTGRVVSEYPIIWVRCLKGAWNYFWMWEKLVQINTLNKVWIISNFIANICMMMHHLCELDQMLRGCLCMKKPWNCHSKSMSKKVANFFYHLIEDRFQCGGGGGVQLYFSQNTKKILRSFSFLLCYTWLPLHLDPNKCIIAIHQANEWHWH